MPRVTIDLPETFAFHTEYRIQPADCGPEHLDNLRILGIAGEARVAMLHAFGYGGDSDIDGQSTILADVAVVYRSEGFAGEVLRIDVTCTAFGRCGCELLWRMQERESGREVARGKWGMVFFDYAERRPAPVPPGFRARFA